MNLGAFGGVAEGWLEAMLFWVILVVFYGLLGVL
jgi:hypothetical protein